MGRACRFRRVAGGGRAQPSAVRHLRADRRAECQLDRRGARRWRETGNARAKQAMPEDPVSGWRPRVIRRLLVSESLGGLTKEQMELVEAGSVDESIIARMQAQPSAGHPRERRPHLAGGARSPERRQHLDGATNVNGGTLRMRSVPQARRADYWRRERLTLRILRYGKCITPASRKEARGFPFSSRGP